MCDQVLGIGRVLLNATTTTVPKPGAVILGALETINVNLSGPTLAHG